MDLDARLIGKHAADVLSARTTSAVLIIGSDRFTRGDLAGVQCFCYIAAARLTQLLKPFRVKHTRDLFDTIAPGDLAIPQLGAISLAVLGAAFQARGIGGDAPLLAWIRKHATADTKDRIVTFDTLKHNAADERAAKQTRQRKAQRRRVSRIHLRTQAADK